MIPRGDEEVMYQYEGGACGRPQHAEGLEAGTLSYVFQCWMLLVAVCVSSDWQIVAAKKFRQRPLH